MNILFLTNFYPPASRGGYEQWCQEVGERLRERGHEVVVLTSTHGQDVLQMSDPAWVRRELHLEMELASLQNAVWFFTRRKKREQENLTLLQRVIKTWVPDAILIWGMWNFPRSLPALVEKLMPEQTAYYMGDYWPTLPGQFENYWNAAPRNFFTGLPKRLLKPIARRIMAHEERPHLQLRRILFPSVFMRDEFERNGIVPQDGRIVYGAIDTAPYLGMERSSNAKDEISLLYIGRLVREKGVHTAVEAVAYLVHKYGFMNLKLTIVGDGENEYVEYLHQLVHRENIASYVLFIPAQPKENLPALYQQSDIFLFTSIWPEPFGRVIIEAMASGIPVAGTTVGGASEILIENENALVFPSDDAIGLAQELKRLVESPALCRKLGNAGRETVCNKFDINRMTDEIASYMEAIAS